MEKGDSMNDINQKYNVWSFGVSNIVKVGSKNKALQFYDVDGKWNTDLRDSLEELFKGIDCLVFQTERGFHFVSFAIKYSRIESARKRAYAISKKYNQDYKFKKKDYLVLRLGAKMLMNAKTQRLEQIISTKPIFHHVFNKPTQDLKISQAHYDLWKRFVGIPISVQELYDCTYKVKGKIKVHYYRTTDKRDLKE